MALFLPFILYKLLTTPFLNHPPKINLMKHIFYLVVSSVIFLQLSCQKQQPGNASKSHLLTSGSWKYEQFFINYNQSNTTLAYSLYKSSNLMDLSKSRMQYKSDGSYTEIDQNGVATTGTWEFNNEENNIQIHYGNNLIVKKLLVLDDRNFQWATTDLDKVAVMIHE